MSIQLSGASRAFGRDLYILGSSLPPAIFYGSTVDTVNITTHSGQVFSTPRVVYAYRQLWGDGEDSLTFFGHKLVSTWRDGEYWEYGFCRYCRILSLPSSIRSACPYSEF